ncbi:hypothetical protein JCM11491_005030 [Sporobolomyces phaffii]
MFPSSAHRFPSPLANLVRNTARPNPAVAARRAFRFPFAPRSPLCTTATATYTPNATSFLASYRFAVFASVPITAFALSQWPSSSSRELQCASDRSYATTTDPSAAAVGGSGGGGGVGREYKEAESILNLRDLGFGTVSGICVGVFVKKGLRAAAFLLGGVFVLMQYMSSRSLININWGALTSSYDSVITSRAGPAGSNRAVGLWNWFIDFVSADVQSRATFVAGVVLGLRIG